MECKVCGMDVDKIAAFGMCERCYGLDLEKRKAAICLGCGEFKPIRAVGYCRKCYNRVLRTGSAELQEKELKNAELCSYCHAKPAHAKTLCKTCYARLLRYGSAKKVEKRPPVFKADETKCAFCGEMFQPRRKTQIHCSRHCYDHDRRKKKPVVRVCRNDECGKEFETTDHRKMFCCDACKIYYFNHARSTRDEESRVCATCGVHFTTSAYHGLYCSYECQRKSEPFINGKRKHELQKKYKITQAEYDDLFDKQNGRCLICGEEETRMRHWSELRLAVDHDHETGKVRGLLCGHCNSGLGMFKDSPAILQKAIDYLNAHNAQNV